MTAETATLEVDHFASRDMAVSWVITDFSGLLLAASREAAAMLNVSVAGLRRRQLVLFFDGGREQWYHALRAAASGLMVDREGAIRPRERRPLQVRAEISLARDWGNGEAVLWTFSEPEPHDHGPS